MKVRGTASSALGTADETGWMTLPVYSGDPSHTLGHPSEVLGRISQVLGTAHICHSLAQPTTWEGQPTTVVAPPEYRCRPTQAPRSLSQSLSRRMTAPGSGLPSGQDSPPSTSCRPAQVARSLSERGPSPSQAHLCGVPAGDVSAPSHFIPGPSQVRGAARKSCVATQALRSRSLVVSWRSKAAPSGAPICAAAPRIRPISSPDAKHPKLDRLVCGPSAPV
jgi:hypothetical protein